MNHYAKATVTIVVVLAILLAAWSVRNILTLVVVAAILAVGLDPAVRRLQRFKLSRGWAVTIIFLATIGFIALFAWLVVPPLVREVKQLASSIPGYIDRLRKSNGSLGEFARKYDLSAKLKELTAKLPSVASASLGKILGITKSVASVIFNLLTIAILTIYFLMALPRGEQLAEAMFSGPHRRRNVEIFEESLHRIGGYVSGNIGISIIAGLAAYPALKIIGVPYAEALALWVAIADLIPSVGATLGALAAVLIAAFVSWGAAVATFAYFIVYQQVENYLIAPRVMKKAVDLSPAAVIVSVLVGGSLAGFAGALLALPIAAAAKVVITEVWLRNRLDATGSADLVPGPALPGSAAGPPAASAPG
jgi:predicted PurR-regulated permease PerM